MDRCPSPAREPRAFGSGVRTAVFIVVLGTIAAVADHAFFIAPRPTGSGVAAAAETSVRAPDPGLPSELHPTAVDVAAPAPTF